MVKRVILYGAALVGLSVVLGNAWSLSAAPRQDARSVHVAVVTNEGIPVTDLTAADFDVKEGGKETTITSAAITSAPLRLALIVADEGTGNFQQAMVTLIKPLVALGEFKLVSVVMQPETVVDYSGNAEGLVAGIEKMGQRAGGQPSGAQLLEAINETLGGIAQPGKRPVMVVMRFGGAATSQIRPEVVRETIRKTGTQLYVLSPPNAGGGGGGMPMSSGAVAARGVRHARITPRPNPPIATETSKACSTTARSSQADGSSTSAAKPSSRKSKSSRRSCRASIRSRTRCLRAPSRAIDCK